MFKELSKPGCEGDGAEVRESERFTRFRNKVNDRMLPGLGESACSPVGVEVGSEMVNGEVIQVAKESVGDAVWAMCSASADRGLREQL